MNRMLPILFNTDMVRAILDGRKTATRRLVKLPKHIQQQGNGLYTLFADGTCYENQYMEQLLDYLKAPYQPGDILYVRETWMTEEFYDDEALIRFRAGGKQGLEYEKGGEMYKKLLKFADDKWHPSLFMPKEAARIWLRVTDVRVERLQAMNGHDILYEGVDNGKSNPAMGARWENLQRMAFAELWNSTIKKSDLDRYGWDANPYVWVIEFERCEKPN